MGFTRLAVVTVLLAASVPGSWTSALAAASYPAKPISVIVPFPAGGRSDLTLRLLGPYLEKALGQPLVILNKPGAGGTIGFRELAQARPDGYTIGFTTNAVVMTQYTVAQNLDLRNYEPISLVNSDPAVLAVAYSSTMSNLPALVKYAKDNPKQLLVGINPGASAHIFAAAFAKAAGIDATLVPYKGGPERVAALAGGHIHADFGVLAQYRSMVNSNKVRIVGVAASTRLRNSKDTPTFKESGVDLQISGWQGVFAPRGTPADVLSRLDEAVKKVLSDPEVLEKLDKIDVQAAYLPARGFADFLTKEDSEAKQLTRELGLAVTAPK